MNRDTVKANRKQMTGTIQEQWVGTQVLAWVSRH